MKQNQQKIEIGGHIDGQIGRQTDMPIGTYTAYRCTDRCTDVRCVNGEVY